MRRKRPRVRSWAILAGLIFVPAYGIAILMSVRAGLLGTSNGATGDEQSKAFWAFAGVFLTSAATFLVALVTREQSRRSEGRLTLDTVVSSLKLVSDGGTQYAPKSVIAGALTTLVHLRHPVIAIRALEPAWKDNAVAATSATWIINEVLAGKDAEAQLDAAKLLRQQAAQLCYEEKGVFSWPAIASDRWPTNLHREVRWTLLEAMLTMLLSKPRDWWLESGALGAITSILYLAMKRDSDADCQRFSAGALVAISGCVDPGLTIKPDGDGPSISYKAMTVEAQEVRQQIPRGRAPVGLIGLRRRVTEWVGPTPAEG